MPKSSAGREARDFFGLAKACVWANELPGIGSREGLRERIGGVKDRVPPFDCGGAGKFCLVERKGAGLVRIWMLMGRFSWERAVSGCWGMKETEGGRPGMLSLRPEGAFGWLGGKMERRLVVEVLRMGCCSVGAGGL